MGRNAGTKIFWTDALGDSNHTFTWYCQQHAKWDQQTNSNPATAATELTNELNNNHGNVNQ